MDFYGSAPGYTVRYVGTVHAEGTGDPIPLRGGADLEINIQAPGYDPVTGELTYNPVNRAELVAVGGWQTFRQVAYGGTFEGYSTVGLGVRARLPFRVFTLDGPAGGSRLVIDVAHRW